jgi:ribosome-associated protein
MTQELDSSRLDELDQDESVKSKTQIKNELKDITRFGMELAEIKLTHLKKLPLSDELIEAFEELGRIKGNEARKRHFKRIGKLLREIELEPIEKALERFQRGLPLIDPQDNPQHQFASQWLQKLIIDDVSPELFIEEFPHCDRQQLRQLIRNAKKSNQHHPKLMAFLAQFHAIDE